jgi:hypothetical protein
MHRSALLAGVICLHVHCHHGLSYFQQALGAHLHDQLAATKTSPLRVTAELHSDIAHNIAQYLKQFGYLRITARTEMSMGK